MNVKAIRDDLAAIGFNAGFEATAYVPERVAAFPAWVVGVPEEVEYGTSLGLARVRLPITIAVALGTFEDAQESIDDQLSTDVAESAVNLLRARPQADSWQQIQVLGAGNVRFSEDADGKALAVDITVDVFTRK